MIREDKELLLKDLCARLPYGVKIKLGDNPNIFDLEYRIKFAVMYGDSDKLEDILDVTNIKPYLFPLSSMAKKQKEEIGNLGWNFDNFEIHNVSECIGNYREFVTHSDCFVLIDWLNKNHFDINGLIEKGLAIDATGLNIY